MLRRARAFTLRRERNEWMYTARTVIAALIITRRKIGLRRCNKCARERNKRRVRMTNRQTISVPSSAVIKDGTTINPVTTSLVPCFPFLTPRNRESAVVRNDEEIVAEKNAISRDPMGDYGYSRYESAILRFPRKQMFDEPSLRRSI